MSFGVNPEVHASIVGVNFCSVLSLEIHLCTAYKITSVQSLKSAEMERSDHGRYSNIVVVKLHMRRMPTDDAKYGSIPRLQCNVETTSFSTDMESKIPVSI